MDRWNEVPQQWQELLRVCMDQSHYNRQWWHWSGKALLSAEGTKMALTLILGEDWGKVETAAWASWDEIAKHYETKAKIVSIFKKYNEDMQKAAVPIAIPMPDRKGGRCPLPP